MTTAITALWRLLLLLAVLSTRALHARTYIKSCGRLSLVESISIANCPIIGQGSPASNGKLYLEPLACWLPDQIAASLPSVEAVEQRIAALSYSQLRGKYFVEFSIILQHQLAINAVKCASADAENKGSKRWLDVEFMPIIDINLSTSNRPRGVTFSDARLHQNGAVATVRMYCDQSMHFTECASVWQKIQRNPSELQDILEFRLTVLTSPKCYKTAYVTRRLSATKGQLDEDSVFTKCWQKMGMECSVSEAETATSRSTSKMPAAPAFYDFRRSCSNLAAGAGGQPRPLLFNSVATSDTAARAAEGAAIARRVAGRGLVLPAGSSAVLPMTGVRLGLVKTSALNIATVIQHGNGGTGPTITIEACSKERDSTRRDFSLSFSLDARNFTVQWKVGEEDAGFFNFESVLEQVASMHSYQILLNQSQLKKLIIDSKPVEMPSIRWPSVIADAFKEQLACVRFSAPDSSEDDGKSIEIACWAAALGTDEVKC